MKFLAILGFLLGTSFLWGQDVTVAAAADTQFALQQIAKRYEADTGRHVNLTFGASGNLTAAIQNGAPYDLFFSADVDYARKLAAAGVADPTTLYEYAIGRLVLWVPKDSPLNVARGMEVLTDPQVRKIAIANPQHAPYGRAAQQAMKSAGIYSRVENKLVLGENISQTAQFVISGNADVGLLSLSLVVATPTGHQAPAGKYWILPANLYSPVRQAAIVIKGQDESAARQFLDFVKSSTGRDILTEYGFEAPAQEHGKPTTGAAKN
jgi:molybdate transport system substrate-binding protein